VQIRAGYDIAFQCFQETPMILMLSIHPSRAKDLQTPHRITFAQDVQARDYLDMFGNTCTRIIAPPGVIEIHNQFLISDSGLADAVVSHAHQTPIAQLPDDVLVYLLLRYPEIVRPGVVDVRRRARRMAAGAGDRRLHA
jgi:hypothetical protein